MSIPQLVTLLDEMKAHERRGKEIRERAIRALVEEFNSFPPLAHLSPPQTAQIVCEYIRRDLAPREREGAEFLINEIEGMYDLPRSAA